jgi:acetyl-CoA carboxylase biotin carboxylase subunit
MAVRVATSAGLTNAATCEFLHDPAGRSWFLEVNTRLQVEHGVTELVTGIDIVREQLWLAAGAPLSAEAVAAAERATDPSDHAIEVRLSAEDPARGFAPSPGRVTRWAMPAGPGVRVDSAIEAGERVSPDYDPLVAKVMVSAPDRPAAIARLRRALDEIEIGGIQTTLPFHRHVARDPSFAAAELSTGWVEEHWDGPADRAEAVRRGLLAAALAAHSIDEPGAESGAATADGSRGRWVATDTRRAAPTDGHHPASRWRSAGLEATVDRWPTS